jgi:hypothetical protein
MSNPLIVAQGDGHKLGNPVGGQVMFKVGGSQSDGEITAFERVIAPGDGPPLHTRCERRPDDLHARVQKAVIHGEPPQSGEWC